VLGDQTLPAALQRQLVQRASVGWHEVAHAEDGRAGVPEDALESGAPGGERQVAQVGGAVEQDVEGDERHRRARDRAPMRGVRLEPDDSRREVDAPLQLLKPGGLTVRVECDDLAVEQDAGLQLAAELAERPDDLRKLRRLVVAKPRRDGDACER
jgi:hypothetical protein